MFDNLKQYIFFSDRINYNSSVEHRRSIGEINNTEK